jgi:hypothetical protein
MKRPLKFDLFCYYFLFTLLILISTSCTTLQEKQDRASPSVALANTSPSEISAPTSSKKSSGDWSVYLDKGGKLEASGLAWYNESLVILSQFPKPSGFRSSILPSDSKGKHDYIHYLPKNEINKDLDESILKNYKLFIDYSKLGPIDDILKNKFDGFEAITFNRDEVFLTIELKDKIGGYLVQGTIDWHQKIISLNHISQKPFKPQTDDTNTADETILFLNDKIYTFYEGKKSGGKYKANVFGPVDLKPKEGVYYSFKYRVTDATASPTTAVNSAQNDHSFWMIDIPHYQGEKGEFFNLALVKYCFNLDEKLINTEGTRIPFYQGVRNENKELIIHNWEGLALKTPGNEKDGFYVINDGRPSRNRTQLIFIPNPNTPKSCLAEN